MAIKFRKGDVVSLQAVVRHDFAEGDDDVTVDIDGALRSDNWVKLQFVTIVRQKIEVGDRVEFHADPSDAETYHCGNVLAICNDHAWIDSGAEYFTRRLDDIRRAED